MTISQSSSFMPNSGTLISATNAVLSATGEPGAAAQITAVPASEDSGASIAVVHPLLPLPVEGYYPIRPLADTTAEAISINENGEMNVFNTVIPLANEMSASIDTLNAVIGVTDNSDNLLSF